MVGWIQSIILMARGEEERQVQSRCQDNIPRSWWHRAMGLCGPVFASRTMTNWSFFPALTLLPKHPANHSFCLACRTLRNKILNRISCIILYPLITIFRVVNRRSNSKAGNPLLWELKAYLLALTLTMLLSIMTRTY